MTAINWTLDLDALTVIAHHDDGSSDDLNACGEPCETIDDLRDFVRELHAQKAISADVSDRLLAETEK